VLRPDLTLLATIYFPLLIILVYLFAFIPSWKKAVHLKEERGWIVSDIKFAETKSSQSRGSLSTMPWGWYIASLIILIATIAITIMRYHELPEMIASHLGWNLQPTTYVQKTWLDVMLMPIVNASTLLIMFLVGISIEKTKLQIDPQNPRLSFAQHRIYRKRYGNAIGILTLCLVISMAGLGLALMFPVSPPMGMILLIVFLALICIPTALIIVVAVTTGQGGVKIKVDIDDEDDDIEAVAAKKKDGCDRGDDRLWKLGMFYYNPDDSAYLVEDRFGTNLGFNFAKPPCMIGAILLAAGLILMYAWITVIML
jgi:uncharacterized membrane protein